MTTARTTEMQEVMAAAQAFNPYNPEDAWYAVCHPDEFDAETLRIAEKIEGLR